MAKSKSITKLTKPTTPDLSTSVAGNVRGLVVTVPILVAVLFTIGYVQLHVAPIADKSSVPTARKDAKSAPLTDLPTLQFAAQTLTNLAPLTVTDTESVLVSVSHGVGDTHATAAAQPAFTTLLQAPQNTDHTEDNPLQAAKTSDDSKKLLDL